MPLESAKIYGLLSMLVPVAVITMMLVIWPHDRGQSISRHSAQGRAPFLLMALTHTFAYPIFMWFAYKWFVPTFDINPLYLVCMTLAAAGLLLAAWVPDVPGLKRKIHEISAYGAAWLFIPSTIVLALTPGIVDAVRVLAALVATYMSTCVILFFTYPRARDYHLPLQSVYILSYFVVVLLATYVR